MYKGKTIAVVVPCHNEELLVGRVIDGCPDFIDRIIVVNDASMDRTAEVVTAAAAANPRVLLITHDVNQGVGGAIVTGYNRVVQEKLDVAVVMAGDNQMDPADLPALLDPVVAGEVDYAKGNRLFTGRAWEVIPRVRYIGNAMLSLLTKIASGYWHVSDSQTGYTAITRQALEMIGVNRIYKRYGMPNDILVRLNIFNRRVRDVPVQPVYNVGEKSGIVIPKVIFTIGFLLVRLFLYRLKEKYVIRDFHPLVFFYLFSFGLLLVDLAIIAWVLYWIVASGGDLGTVRYSLSASGFLTIMVFQFAFFAMWFDLDYNKDLK